jgi:hypothetical protein
MSPGRSVLSIGVGYILVGDLKLSGDEDIKVAVLSIDYNVRVNLSGYGRKHIILYYF